MAAIPQEEIDQAVDKLLEFVNSLDGGFGNQANRLKIGEHAESIVNPFVGRYDSQVSAGDIWYPGKFFTDEHVELAQFSSYDDMVFQSARDLIYLAQAKLASNA